MIGRKPGGLAFRAPIRDPAEAPRDPFCAACAIASILAAWLAALLLGLHVAATVWP